MLRQTQTATDDNAHQTQSVTRTVYDGCGRVLQVITDDYVAGEDGLNDATPVDSYADSTKGTLNAYDSRGNLTYERNSQGVVTHFAYSDTNKLVREAFDKYVFAYDYQIEPSELDGQTVSYIRTITVAGQNYATEYYTDKDLLIAKAFANGQALRYNYNEDGDLTAQYHDSDETPFVIYTYDSEGALQSKTNTDTGLRTVYTGDLTEVYQIASDGTETLYYSYSNEETTDSGKTTRIYSANTLGTEVSRKVTDNTASYTAGSHAFTVQSAEDSANRTATETLTAGDKTLGTTSRTYDEQGRVTAETITYGENQLYLSYQYDDQGRLTYYRQGRDADKDDDAQISRYQYDGKGQLVRENIFFDNDRAGITRTYTYDKRGNITSAKTYKYNTGDLSDQTPTKSYTCTYKSGDDVWEDELVNATAIDENSSLLYDANGNPLNYSEAAVRWSAGRQLSKISGVDENGNEEVYASFIYDENGIRTSEQSTEPGMSWNFTTEDGVVTGRQNDNGKNYRFIYDENGRPTAFMLNDALYYYITNQMGDVIGVADADGNLALEYYYDAWGDNFTARPDSCDYDGKTGWNGAYRLYNDNPIKYRSYYFDHAIGMYYLQSRYFHTDINRFFNADDPDIAKQSKDVPVGMNLFAYCNNDPVNGVDPTGYKAKPKPTYKVSPCDPQLSKIDIGILLVLFVAYYIEPKKLKNYDFWTSRLVIDNHRLAISKITYRSSKKPYGKKSSFQIAFGNSRGWQPMTTMDGNINHPAMDYHYESIKNEMLKSGTVSLNDASNLGSVQVSFVTMCCYLIHASAKQSQMIKYYDRVWGKGKGGLSKGKQRYYLFRIFQGPKSLNGWYAMRNSDGKVTKL